MNLDCKIIREATAFLPDTIRYPISVIKEEMAEQIKEIRLKRECPVAVITSNQRLFLRFDGSLTYNLNQDDICIAKSHEIDDAVRRLCNYSLHAFQNEMKNGYITVLGGHRVGIGATAVTNAQGELTAIKNVASLNIRIAKEVIGAADALIKNVFNSGIKSVLIVGEPSSGKTTVLRDVASRLSGTDFDYLRVCVVDERSEIAAISDGISQKSLGIGCDVLDGYPKAEGMMIALRAMSPDVIICDEIGADGDVAAVESVANAGVKIIATIHASSFSQLVKRPQFARLMQTSAFDVAVVLLGKNMPGEIKEIVPLKRYWR